MLVSQFRSRADLVVRNCVLMYLLPAARVVCLSPAWGSHLSKAAPSFISPFHALLPQNVIQYSTCQQIYFKRQKGMNSGRWMLIWLHDFSVQVPMSLHLLDNKGHLVFKWCADRICLSGWKLRTQTWCTNDSVKPRLSLPIFTGERWMFFTTYVWKLILLRSEEHTSELQSR